ncbi:MAG: thiamine pyrophosphate-dependent enzyme [Candidatus Omnitrophica bacterium]|nr:thiamine pyrophosphate-dependent enzyme [Candidatus Omnitrophota bacterium]
MAKDLNIAKDILRVRLGQMIINEKLKNNEFKIPIHLALGHEAIAAAVNAVMKDSDQLVLSHRNVHYNLVRSSSLKAHINEYLLKKDGLAAGRLGSMNLANETRGLIYTSSILGNNLCVSCGLSLASKIKKIPGIVIVVTGDGGIEEGAFYESLLFMRTYSLSSLIIIENNEWSLATKIPERRCNIYMKRLASTFDIPFEVLKGNDPFTYSASLSNLRTLSLKKKLPVIVEVKLRTLGDWCLKTDEFPQGKFINYHCGAAPTVKLSEWPVIEKDDSDPVYVLLRHFKEAELEKISRVILRRLHEEIQ